MRSGEICGKSLKNPLTKKKHIYIIDVTSPKLVGIYNTVYISEEKYIFSTKGPPQSLLCGEEET